MAMAPPRPCTHPKCKVLHCTEHQVEAWRTRDRPQVKRVRGRELQRRRARLFAAHPWCVRCMPKGVRTRATIRDHKIPLAEGGLDDETNVQGLCQSCSDTKTRDESTRGVRRR